jgi:hypothetical protein
MPRYHFKVIDHTPPSDLAGLDLPDLNAARHMAVQTAGKLLSQIPEAFWEKREWQMVVTDEQGLTQFALTFFATDAPAINGPSPPIEISIAPNPS